MKLLTLFWCLYGCLRICYFSLEQWHIYQPAFTCSKSTKETPEQSEFCSKLKKKITRTMPLMPWRRSCSFEQISHTNSVSDFEQVNDGCFRTFWNIYEWIFSKILSRKTSIIGAWHCLIYASLLYNFSKRNKRF